MNDPIADMLTRIRNAKLVSKDEVFVPYSNIKFRIAEILKEEGYIVDVEKQEGPSGAKLRVLLKYHEKNPAITEMQRVSRPGQRIYAKKNELPRVLQGMGIAIVSTSKGIMTGQKAREMKLGGEIICKVW